VLSIEKKRKRGFLGKSKKCVWKD